MNGVSLLSKTEQAYSVLSEFMNTASIQQKMEFVALMNSDHGYIQQQTFNLFIESCKVMHRNHVSGNFNPTNEDAVKSSTVILGALGHIRG